jgi:hypothetical protein
MLVSGKLVSFGGAASYELAPNWGNVVGAVPCHLVSFKVVRLLVYFGKEFIFTRCHTCFSFQDEEVCEYRGATICSVCPSIICRA